MNELEQGIAAFRAGQRDEARKLFALALRQNPNDPRAWQWLYNAANNDQERLHCLREILRLQPQNDKAAQLLAKLNGPPLNPANLPPVPQSLNQNNKKSSSGVFIAVLIGGFVFLCFGCVVLSVLGQAVGLIPKPTLALTPQAFPTLQAKALQTDLPIPIQPTFPTSTDVPFPTSTDVPLPTATDIPQPIFALGSLGERIERSGIALTVLKVFTVKRVNEYIEPKAGYVYLIADVLIENISRSDESPYNPLYFSLKDSDGFQYNPSLFGPDPALQSGNLPQGDKVRGNVAFEVKSSASGFVVTYDPMVILGGYGPIRIRLTP